MSSLFSASDILRANLLHESGEESNVDDSNDESEDYEDDEIEYEEKNDETIHSNITLTSLVPSLDAHIENFNEISFNPTFLNEPHIDSTFNEGIQDFEEYSKSLNVQVANKVQNLTNNILRSNYESEMVRSDTFEIQAWDTNMLQSDYV